MRFDWEPLEERLRLMEVDGELATSRRLQAHILGVSSRQVKRWVHIGLDFWQADKAAVAAGWVPYVLWPEWLDESIRLNEQIQAPCKECGGLFYPNRTQVYCSTACRLLARKKRAEASSYASRRYQANRETLKARRRAYYQQNGSYERARQREYDRARRLQARQVRDGEDVA